MPKNSTICWQTSHGPKISDTQKTKNLIHFETSSLSMLKPRKASFQIYRILIGLNKVVFTIQNQMHNHILVERIHAAQRFNT